MDLALRFGDHLEDRCASLDNTRRKRTVPDHGDDVSSFAMRMIMRSIPVMMVGMVMVMDMVGIMLMTMLMSMNMMVFMRMFMNMTMPVLMPMMVFMRMFMNMTVPVLMPMMMFMNVVMAVLHMIMPIWPVNVQLQVLG